MLPVPARLLNAVAEAARPGVAAWWAGLGDDDRADLAILCDERQEVCFFGAVPDDEVVPAVHGGRFVPHDDANRRDEWIGDYLEYLLGHPEAVPFADVLVRTFHIGCTAHPAARACLEDRHIPADFACPLQATDCPMRRALPRVPGRGLRLVCVGLAGSP